MDLAAFGETHDRQADTLAGQAAEGGKESLWEIGLVVEQSVSFTAGFMCRGELSLCKSRVVHV